MRLQELESRLGILIIIFSSVSIALGWEKANLQTLELVQIMMRHGDRNPIWTFPLDPHKNDPTYWPGGFEQLTDVGVKQTHELGQFFRERYDGFISKTYISDEVSAWSSFKDRSIRSGMSFLRGMYPKVNRNARLTETVSNTSIYDDGEESQVVPLRTIPKELDDHIYNGVECPRWKQLEDESVLSSPEGRRLEDLSVEIVKTLKNYTGLKGTLNDVGIVFDYLICQKLQKKTLPHWATPDVVEFGEKFINYRLSMETLTNEMKRLRSGIVRNVAQNMEKKAKKKTSEAGNLKFALYSGHDRTIITFLNILDLYNRLKTYYASAVLVELHKSPNFSDHTVEIYFRNDTTVEPYKLEMKKCRHPCLLSKFLEIAKPFFPDDYEKACQLSGGSIQCVQTKLIIVLAFLLATVYKG